MCFAMCDKLGELTAQNIVLGHRDMMKLINGNEAIIKRFETIFLIGKTESSMGTDKNAVF